MTDLCPRYSGWGPFTGECNWDRHPDGTCQYCGSMNPTRLMERLEAGTVRLTPTDKSYKLYVDNEGGEGFKQTYRDCPLKSDCTYENCTHWVTRDTEHQKFYFQHLSETQMDRFIELFNAKLLKFHGGSFYVLPFFMRLAERPMEKLNGG